MIKILDGHGDPATDNYLPVADRKVFVRALVLPDVVWSARHVERSVVISAGGDDQVLNLILDTSREGISAIRVASDDGDLYEVAPLGKLSAITFPQPASGYVVSLMAGEETIYQQSG